MLMLDYKELSWWYWLASVCLLSAGLAGYHVRGNILQGMPRT